MSEPRRDDEPTMEEILASIRKIISEDDPETASRAEDASGSEDDESEPMELTQMVSEDGSVVDLRSEARPSLVPFAAEIDEETDDETDDERAVVESLVPAGTRVHAEMVDEALVDEALVDEDDDVELDAQDRNAAESDIEVEPDDESDIEPEPAVSRAAPPKREGLVSPEVAAAASAAMARLKDSLAAGAPIGGGKSMEDLVREAMVPHLQAWLDENLPALVERIVREEIEKIAEGSEPR